MSTCMNLDGSHRHQHLIRAFLATQSFMAFVVFGAAGGGGIPNFESIQGQRAGSVHIRRISQGLQRPGP